MEVFWLVGVAEDCRCCFGGEIEDVDFGEEEGLVWRVAARGCSAQTETIRSGWITGRGREDDDGDDDGRGGSVVEDEGGGAAAVIELSKRTTILVLFSERTCGFA